MTEQLKLKLNDSKATRWGALVIVAFTLNPVYIHAEHPHNPCNPCPKI